MNQGHNNSMKDLDITMSQNRIISNHIWQISQPDKIPMYYTSSNWWNKIKNNTTHNSNLNYFIFNNRRSCLIGQTIVKLIIGKQSNHCSMIFTRMATLLIHNWWSRIEDHLLLISMRNYIHSMNYKLSVIWLKKLWYIIKSKQH
jgi:hypothetical protein